MVKKKKKKAKTHKETFGGNGCLYCDRYFYLDCDDSIMGACLWQIQQIVYIKYLQFFCPSIIKPREGERKRDRKRKKILLFSHIHPLKRGLEKKKNTK